MLTRRQKVQCVNKVSYNNNLPYFKMIRVCVINGYYITNSQPSNNSKVLNRITSLQSDLHVYCSKSIVSDDHPSWLIVALVALFGNSF
ncbi:hypothetical protein Glove_140g167 [Diversispora epigaea]|uniref:Uncharacterized protein n=1 Tax=Diversispora epigaea TaxID=1348612 RepID=A0A397IV36_9GLOM|nr:hypothetical protein Glove_140g167 [Diversispora epigaea]